MTVIISVGCKEKEPANIIVETVQLHDITSNSAIGGGTVSVDAMECGLCWGITPNPSIVDEHVAAEVATKEFICTITELEPNTTYHVRAYAICNTGIEYGADVVFTTTVFIDDNYVDLGLPSGTLWARCNVGAASPEVYGGYYRNKYNQYTPSVDDWVELMDHCVMVWTERNGINGQLVTSPNGNSIFLPAAGYRSNDSIIDNGLCGHYWSSSYGAHGPYVPAPETPLTYDHLFYQFDDSDYDMYFGYMNIEVCIRTVLHSND